MIKFRETQFYKDWETNFEARKAELYPKWDAQTAEKEAIRTLALTDGWQEIFNKFASFADVPTYVKDNMKIWDCGKFWRFQIETSKEIIQFRCASFEIALLHPELRKFERIIKK